MFLPLFTSSQPVHYFYSNLFQHLQDRLASRYQDPRVEGLGEIIIYHLLFTHNIKICPAPFLWWKLDQIFNNFLWQCTKSIQLVVKIFFVSTLRSPPHKFLHLSGPKSLHPIGPNMSYTISIQKTNRSTCLLAKVR